MSKRYRVGILGATGTVGQRFCQLLDGHPQFEITALAASDRSAGKPYSEACAWKLPGKMPANVREIVVTPIEPPPQEWSAPNQSRLQSYKRATCR